MKETLILTFDPDGTGHCLYNELIDLHVLGTLECRRASHIEFDRKTQQWQVLSPDRQRVLFSSPSRITCEDWEHTHLIPA